MKLEQKIYYRHLRLRYGMKEMTLKEKLDKKPESVIELVLKACFQMTLGRAMIKKLLFMLTRDPQCKAQKPEELTHFEVN